MWHQGWITRHSLVWRRSAGTQYIHSHRPVHDIKALWTSRCTKCFICTASTTALSTYVKPRHAVGKLVIWTQAVWPQSAHQKPCPQPVSPSSAPPSGFSSSWWEDRNAFSWDTPPVTRFPGPGKRKGCLLSCLDWDIKCEIPQTQSVPSPGSIFITAACMSKS